MKHPLILIFGRDPTLLKTRSWLLAKTGSPVLLSTSLSEVEKVAATQQIELLVICHSVPMEACQELLTAAPRLQSDMKKLLITANTEVCSMGKSERTVSAFSGPAVLLETAKLMLQVD